MLYGVVVMGSGGSGKSTCCKLLARYYRRIGRRCAIINVDPGNEYLTYNPAVDVRDLITVDDVQAEFGLGPNGALIYAVQFIAANIQWLHNAIADAVTADAYCLFDFPGAIELPMAHTTAIRTLFDWLTSLSPHISLLNLTDSYHTNNAHTFLSVIVSSMAAMTATQLPTVNVISKMDIANEKAENNNIIAMIMDRADTQELVEQIQIDLEEDDVDDDDDGGSDLDGENDARHVKSNVRSGRLDNLTRALLDVIASYSLVSYTPLDITSNQSIAELIALIDKSNGAVYKYTNTEAKRFDDEDDDDDEGEQSRGLQPPPMADVIEHYPI